MLTAGVICILTGALVAGASVIAGILNMNSVMADDGEGKSLFKRHLKAMLGMAIGSMTFLTGVGFVIAHFVGKYA